mmetsp:Transcript_21037/g.46989  ORF Transcript_21037/g.46989 Transcript_21037/m.46989 type:complete len:250 (-) Transcript_21037:680-1429(-)
MDPLLQAMQLPPPLALMLVLRRDPVLRRQQLQLPLLLLNLPLPLGLLRVPRQALLHPPALHLLSQRLHPHRPLPLLLLLQRPRLPHHHHPAAPRATPVPASPRRLSYRSSPSTVPTASTRPARTLRCSRSMDTLTAPLLAETLRWLAAWRLPPLVAILVPIPSPVRPLALERRALRDIPRIVLLLVPLGVGEVLLRLFRQQLLLVRRLLLPCRRTIRMALAMLPVMAVRQQVAMSLLLPQLRYLRLLLL